MEINLTPTEEEGIAHLAAINGFATPEEYAADLLGRYASLPSIGDDAERRRSVEALERSHQEVLAGNTRDLGEALDDIAKKYQLPAGP